MHCAQHFYEGGKVVLSRDGEDLPPIDYGQKVCIGDCENRVSSIARLDMPHGRLEIANLQCTCDDPPAL